MGKPLLRRSFPRSRKQRKSSAARLGKADDARGKDSVDGSASEQTRRRPASWRPEQQGRKWKTEISSRASRSWAQTPTNPELQEASEGAQELLGL